MIATCDKIFRLRKLRQRFPGVGFNAYPQRDVDATYFFRELISRRSAASGHDRPPLFEGIDLFKIDSLRDEFVFGTPQLLIRLARARAAK